MGKKTLAEAAREVLEGQTLTEGGLPNIGPITGGVSNPNPVDPSTVSTRNAKTLRPAGGSNVKPEGVFGNPGGGQPGDFPDAPEIGAAPLRPGEGSNLGAAAAGGKKRDKSIKGSGNNEQPMKHLEEDDEIDGYVVEEEKEDDDKKESLKDRLKRMKHKKHEDSETEEEEKCESKCHNEEFEISEELEAFIEEAIEAGLNEEEIAEAIDENFEFISEEEEQIEEGAGKALKAAGYTAGPKDSTTGFGRTYTHPKGGSAYVDADGFAHFGSGKKATVTHGRKETEAHLSKIREDYEDLSEELENYEVDMSEHVNALLEGENLSEEFHAKATTIFESAVQAKIQEEIELLEQAYAETLEERIAEIQEELTANVNEYLNYVVEQWIEENEVAVESALRSELTEDFISGLRALFAEHYIDVPEEEVPVVEELSQTVEELEDRLNEEMQKNVELNAMLSESRKDILIGSVCEGLTTTQASKLQALAENVSYTDDDTFIEKISTLRENYFPVATKNDYVLDNVVTNEPSNLTEGFMDDRMEKYVKALGKTQLK